MRRLAVKTLALALVLSGVAISLGQQETPYKNAKRVEAEEEAPRAKQKAPPEKQKAPPAKSKLEEMLAEALRNNPDIRVAAAKLAEADAELNRARLQVTQKVVTLYYAIQTQKKTIELQETNCGLLDAKYKSGQIQPEKVQEARQALTLAKGKLEELEAQLPALLGKTAQMEALYGQTIKEARLTGVEALFSSILTRRAMIEEAEWEKTDKTTGPIAERLRKALQTPVRVDFQNMSLFEILNNLSGHVEELPFRNVVTFISGERKTNLRFAKALPVSAILQALTDEFGCSFYVREYGILAAKPEAAPEGAMTVEQFLRQKPADEPRLQRGEGKNPPAKEVEGLVKSVDASGLMTLSIGSDAGLKKGHTLELFRLLPGSKYLGTVRILEVETKQSVARPIGRLAAPPQKDDRVASRIMGR